MNELAKRCKLDKNLIEQILALLDIKDFEKYLLAPILKIGYLDLVRSPFVLSAYVHQQI